MELSAAGLDLIKKSEGFRGHIYADIAGLPTIGYGHRLLHRDSFPNGVTEELATHMLACDVDDAEGSVLRLVKVPLTQGQFDALVDFTFNLGEGRLAGSTLLELLNARKYDDAGEQLLLWDHSGARKVPALTARRQAEYKFWHTPDPDKVEAAA